MERSHKKLDVWRESVDLSVKIFEVTEIFPKTEIYGLTSQMRCAAVSIASNIAEGAARFSNKEFLQFLNIANGSLSELDTQLDIAVRLGFLPASTRESMNINLESLAAKLAGLINSVRRKGGETAKAARR